MQFYLNGYRVGDPQVLPAAPGAMEASEGSPRRSGRPHRRLRSGWPCPCCAVGRLPRHQDPHRRQAGRARSSLARPTALPAVPSRCSMRSDSPSACSRRRTGSTKRSSGSRIPRDRTKIVRSGRIQDTEDGLSEFPHVIVNQARVHDYLLEVMRESVRQARAALQPSRQACRGRRFRRLPGDGHPAANGARPSRAGGNRSGPLRRRLRWLAQQRPAIDWPLLGGRRGQPGVGCHGCPRGHRLPGHPPQVGDSLRQRGERPHHPARGRLPGPLLHRARQAQP